MLTRWTTTMIGGCVLVTLTACAERSIKRNAWPRSVRLKRMGMPTSMTPPDPFTLTQDFGGAPSVTIQDSPGMGLDIAQGIPIIIPVQAFRPADRRLVLVDQVPVLHLQRMHRHECSSGRTRSCEASTSAVY